jgi:hypothetical protein
LDYSSVLCGKHGLADLIEPALFILTIVFVEERQERPRGGFLRCFQGGPA